MPVNMLQFEKNHQERLKIEVRKPTGLKIDGYLEKYKEIRYNYVPAHGRSILLQHGLLHPPGNQLSDRIQRRLVHFQIIY